MSQQKHNSNRKWYSYRVRPESVPQRSRGYAPSTQSADTKRWELSWRYKEKKRPKPNNAHIPANIDVSQVPNHEMISQLSRIEIGYSHNGWRCCCPLKRDTKRRFHSLMKLHRSITDIRSTIRTESHCCFRSKICNCIPTTRAIVVRPK